MPSMEELLRACETWTTPREASERVGDKAKHTAAQLKLAVRRGWAESRFSDGRGTEYRALPGWEAMMVRRERAPMPPKPSPLKVAIVRALEAGPMTIAELAEAVGRDQNNLAQSLHAMRLQGLVESTPTGPRSVGRGGHRVIYTLRKTVSEESERMGEEKKPRKDDRPHISAEAEECEMDVRNEP